jgi:hypothetical protein
MGFLATKKVGGPLSSKKIEVKLSFPYRGQTFIACHDLSLFARVVIVNHTDTVASFYEDWNMWGYFNIAFEIRTDKGVDTILKRGRNWPKNFPSFVSLFPNDSLVLSYNLLNSDCQQSVFTGSVPSPKHGLKGIKAIYQLDSSLHALANVDNEIKHKYHEPKLPLRREVSRGQRKQQLIVDSLKTPIEAKRTFPMVKLASEEYRF